jgi:pimeloyl-ACP methyl ester carboxylesterase
MKMLIHLTTSGIYLIAMATLLASGSIPNAQKTVKNIVLVHGAFADGSGWEGVYKILTKKGYKVSIASNPLTGFADDVTAVKRVIDRQDGPVILVGHSYGGAVITEAGNDPKVVGLVYVSAFVPDANRLYSSYCRPGFPHRLQGLFLLTQMAMYGMTWLNFMLVFVRISAMSRLPLWPTPKYLCPHPY